MQSPKPIFDGKYILLSFLWCISLLLSPKIYAQSDLNTSITTHDFGVVSIGNTGSQYIVLENTGPAAISISDISFTGADAELFSTTLADFPTTIPGGGELSIFVEFVPNSPGAKEATMTIEHNGDNADPDIDLDGEGCEFITAGGGDIYMPTGDAIKVEIENEAPTGDWTSYSATVNAEPITYYTWEGGTYSGLPGAAGILTYEFAILSPGIYHFQIFSIQGAPGSPGDENDIWAKFDAGDVKAIQGDPMTPTSTVDIPDGDWFVAYKASIDWDWETLNVFGNGHDIYVEFTQGGIYELQLSARSPGFSIDKFVIYKGAQDPDAIAFSTTGTAQACPDDIYYADIDGDGFGDEDHPTYADGQPTGYVGNDDDCDDENVAAFPGNPEIEDGIDNNCDGEVDEGFAPLFTWYLDDDDDGFGDPDETVEAETQPTGYVANDEDCDDTNDDINPDATEIFDGVDNDCDGDIDEGLVPWYEDDDNDDFGNPAIEIYAVTQPAGFVADNTDCDDTDATVYPGAPEQDDDKDNDCDGDIDEGFTDWREIKAFGGEPVPRHENAFVKAGDKFLLVGGRSSDTKFVEKYDPVLNEWTQGALHPMEMHHFQAVNLDGLIYVIGAFTGDFPDEVGIRNVFIYDPVKDQWHQGPPIPEDRVRGGTGAVAYEGKIYIVSGATDGHRSGHVTWFDVFDPRTNTWEQLPDAPNARDHFFVELWGDKLILAGGRRSKYENGGLHSDLLEEIDVYDISDSTWTTLPTLLPTKRAGAATALIGDEIFVIGGETGDQQDAYEETEGLNLLTNTWTTYDPLNEGRHGTQAVVSNEVAYIAAGSRLQGADEIKFDDGFYMEMFSPTQTYNAPNGIALEEGHLNGGANYGFITSDSTIIDTVAVVNGIGNQAIIIRSLSFAGLDRGEFTITPIFETPADPFGDFEPFVLAPGDSLKFRLVFTPNDATEKDAYFEIEHSGSSVPDRVYIEVETCFGAIGEGGGDYKEAGGLLMMEVEDQDPNGWTTNTGGGMTWYTWNGGDYWGGGDAGNFGYLNYPFEITTPGTYRFQLHSLQGNFGNPDAEDDIWINFPNATWYTTVGGGNIPLGGWTKIYQNDVSGWSWETYAILDGSEIYVEFPAAGTYNFEISGRSNGFSIDKVVLYTGTQDPDLIPESSKGGEICVNDWYFDGDLDGFGNPLAAIQSEVPIDGYVGNNSDCDDNDPALNPNSADPDDGIDNNCDGFADEGWIGQCETIRINTGSDSSYVDQFGNLFEADNFNYYTASVPFGNDTLAIDSTLDSVLYISERTSLPGQQTFSYDFPVVNGPYQVIFHFAEIFHGVAVGTGDGIGKRLVNVDIEDTLRISNFDIVLEAGGPATAITDTIDVYVSDNELNLFFYASADNPKISALEIIPTAECGRSAVPLPVELVTFEAKQVEDVVNLRWVTSEEINNSHFVVERTGSNGRFQPISSIPSQGSGVSLRAYMSTDYRPLPGTNYYRLKQVDIDGQFTYSSIVEVTMAEEQVVVYPNPLRKGHNLKIDISVQEDTDINIQLMSLQGQIISRHTLNASPSTDTYEIPVNYVAEGTYLLRIQYRGKQKIQKIIVLE